MYYRNAQSALVVYDLTKPTSLVKAKHWVAELQRQASPGIVIGLVGNKLDLTNAGSEEGDTTAAAATDDSQEGGGEEGEAAAGGGGSDGIAATSAGGVAGSGDARKISTKEGRDYAEEEGLLFFETSAKSGVNVQEVFTAIANAIPETQMKTSRGGAGGAAAGGGGAGGGASGGGHGTALGADRVNLAGGRNDGVKEGCAC